MASPEQTSPQNIPAEFGGLYSAMADLLAQKKRWESEVEAFREAFTNKVDPYIGVGTGWVHYEYLHVNPVSSDVETKEVLFIKLSEEGKRSSAKGKMPMIKIITNEMFCYRNEEHCLSEDILIDQDNDALYHLDVCMLEGLKQDEMEFSEALPFVVPADDEVLFIDFQLVPPRVNIADDGDTIIVPFGLYDCRQDNEYALKKAWEILGEVWEENPKHLGTS